MDSDGRISGRNRSAYPIALLVFFFSLSALLHVRTFTVPHDEGDETVYLGLAREMGWDFSNYTTRDLPGIRRYAPRFLGCDPIVIWESDRAVLGSTRFGAFYNDQLYLFTSDQNRQSFKQDPDRYIRTRVVLRVDEIEHVIR